jgi:HD-GYP domain-containing protein (c-di-GMP phosphodiesterase class II)
VNLPDAQTLTPIIPSLRHLEDQWSGQFFMPFIEVEDPGDLQVGTFVKLEGSWFSHPFPTNTFKIKSAEDLATIQSLKNVAILHDPERSASLDVDDGQDEHSLPLDSETDPGVSNEGEDCHDSELDQSGIDTPLIQEAALSEIMDRREAYHEFQDHLRKVEGAYHKTLGQGHDLFRQLSDRRPAGLKTADTMIAGIVTAMDNPKTAMSLVDVAGSNGVAWGLSEHALNVCMLSLLIGRQLGLEAEGLQELGRGALFHDVGYRALPMKVRFSMAGMKIQSDPELEQCHPEVGRKLMASFPDTGPAVLAMISQHHERMDGSGFPYGMKAPDLSLLTKIVMVADYYDELCNAPDPQSSLSPHAALSRLFRHVVMTGDSSKFCRTVVQALVQAIGVYPPGSLVELTDGDLGVVSLISIHNPTKPSVLLYAPWLCRNDGMLVNLAQESELEIKRAMHPRDIPEQALAYLSPRRMAMFVHATEPTTMAMNSRRQGSSLKSRRKR